MASINKKIIRACTIPGSLEFVEPMLDNLKAEGYEVALLSAPGPEWSDFQKMHDNKCIIVPMERQISLTKDLKSLCQLVKLFLEEKPDMVHSMTPKAGFLCMIAAWLVGVPKRVHTFTGLVWPTAVGNKRRILMLTDKILCACATHIIPEGEGVKNDLENHITNKPMKVLGHGNCRGIDMDFWTKKNVDAESLGLGKEKKFNFLFVGRIVKDKGINELIDAFTALHEKYNNIRLVIVGVMEESLDPISEQAKKQILTNPDIITVGHKSKEDLVKYYSASECFVFPSYREGFPNTPLEAGAVGLPCIATDINGSREIIENNKNGIIIPSKDAKALYNAMERMLIDVEARHSMAKNARKMVESKFEQKFVQKCLMDFYKEIFN